MEAHGPYGEMGGVIARLSNLSIKGYYNPYTTFEWPDEIQPNHLWMSEDLLSVYESEIHDQLSIEQIIALSKWESINFYSLNIHGIRELLMSVVSRLHSPRHRLGSDFFHHFVGEENDHMWFFAEFCYKYAGKIYPDLSIKLDGKIDPHLDDLITFAKITIFEEIVDFYNIRMGKDITLPQIVQDINHQHHVDESRHIAFGRQLMEQLISDLKRTRPDALPTVQRYIEGYLNLSLRSFYSPTALRDAGIENPLKVRNDLLAGPSFYTNSKKIIRRTENFLKVLDLISENWEPRYDG